MTHYTFSKNIREYAGDNTKSLLAFIFIFFVLEAAFIKSWVDTHVMSFVLVHLGLILLSTWCLMYSHKLKSLEGDYNITLTDKELTAFSPHPIIGDSFKIELKELKKLVFLYTVDHEKKTINHTNRLFFIDTGVSEFLLPEFPGHNCEELFKIIKTVSPETSLLSRQIQLKESLALSKRYFHAFKM